MFLSDGERVTVTDIACDLDGALDATSARHFDLALVDVRLDAESGFHVVEELHAQHPELPTLLMSGLDKCEIEPRALGLRCPGRAREDRPRAARTGSPSRRIPSQPLKPHQAPPPRRVRGPSRACWARAERPGRRPQRTTRRPSVPADTRASPRARHRSALRGAASVCAMSRSRRGSQVLARHRAAARCSGARPLDRPCPRRRLRSPPSSRRRRQRRRRRP